MSPLALWFRAFALTLAIELPVAFPLLRRADASRVRRIGAIGLANLMSHPIVWSILQRLFVSRTAFLLASESWAVAIEAATYVLLFPRLARSRALGVSALANGASYLFGSALMCWGLSF
jgi:hypothetical protein